MERAHELTSREPEKSSSPASDGQEIADFECNICFDLAQDPVITLCGHLHCWPCLYKWLKLHSQCHECPVCNALIEEETLIPLYGRGNTTAEPRLIPTLDIPHRPTGQRPETAPPPPPPEANNLTDTVYRRIDGFIPMGPPAFSRFTMSAGFGGVLSPVFGFHEFADETRNGGSSGFHYGEGGGRREDSVVGQRNDDNLKKILVFVLLFVLFDFLTI